MFHLYKPHVPACSLCDAVTHWPLLRVLSTSARGRILLVLQEEASWSVLFRGWDLTGINRCVSETTLLLDLILCGFANVGENSLQQSRITERRGIRSANRQSPEKHSEKPGEDSRDIPVRPTEHRPKQEQGVDT